MKTCKICKAKFEPVRPLQTVCGFKCATVYGKQQADKARISKARKEAKAHKEAKAKAKTLTQWLNEAQVWVNRYIRLRDAGKGCISCGTKNPNIQYCAGHYRTRKAASHLRYNHDNLHLQCNHQCNQMLSGNISAYRPALINKIGLDRVEAIENDNRVHKWTIDEAKSIISIHKLLIKDLTK